MSELRTLIPKPNRAFLADARKLAPEDPKQRKLMLGSLCLLLLALGIVLWHNRDFWFPSAADTEADEAVETVPVAKVERQQPLPSPSAGAKTPAKAQAKHRAAPTTPDVSAPMDATLANPETAPLGATATTTRTVLPPLEIEVVAGDSHRTVRPGNNSVRVDLEPGTPARPVAEPTASADSAPAANVTSNAAERIEMSANASEIVARPVRPDYPLLARQMRVQGSVVLQALIGRDGIIQNLQVVSGPRILASAAQDAVRQWHFKPHFEGDEPVETQAKITVNFTISTN